MGNQKINKLVFNSKGLKGRVEGKLSPRSGFKYLKSKGAWLRMAMRELSQEEKMIFIVIF